jgi:hypothetical protein
MPRVERAIARGLIPSYGSPKVHVVHDEGCQILAEGKECECEHPVVYITTVGGRMYLRSDGAGVDDSPPFGGQLFSDYVPARKPEEKEPGEKESGENKSEQHTRY